MAHYLALFIFLLLAFGIINMAAATPTLITSAPIPLPFPATVPPLQQTTETMMQMCHACRNVLQFCHCMVVNNAAYTYNQHPLLPPQQYRSPAPSAAPYYAPDEEEAQSQSYSKVQQADPPSYYSQHPHSSYAYTTSQSTLENAWVDSVYTASDREDPRLGNYYSQSRSETLLNPVIQYLASSALSPGPSPLDGPAGIDSASIDPRLLSLPTNGADNSGTLVWCPHCPKSFFPRSLKRHIQRQHNPQIARYQCSTCDFTSIKETDVDRHNLSVHAQQRPYVCEHCSAAFGRSDNMKRHIRKKHAHLIGTSL